MRNVNLRMDIMSLMLKIVRMRPVFLSSNAVGATLDFVFEVSTKI